MAAPLVERLSAQDIPLDVALSNAIGWPDTEAEWRVIHESAVVLGVRREGVLVGQGALGCFEGAGSVAKMVVAKDARGQGIGGAILDALLAEAKLRALPVVGLVATPLGQPLYEKRGFRALGEIVIMMGTASRAETPHVEPVTDAEQIIELETRFFGSSRASVLRGRLRDSCATALSKDGFALATGQPAGARVGPILASDEAAARTLTAALFGSIRGPVRLDVPAEQVAYRSWLRSLGLIEKGTHIEMSLGEPQPAWCSRARFGLATQAWG